MSEKESAAASQNVTKKMSLPAEYKFDRYLLAFSLVISGVFVFLAAVLGIMDENWWRYLALDEYVAKPFFYVGFAFFGYHMLFRDKGPSGKLSNVDVLFRRIVSIMILVLVVVPALLYGFGNYDATDPNDSLIKVSFLIEGISILVIGLFLWMIYWGSTSQGCILPLPTAKGEENLLHGMQGLMRFLMSIFVLVWGIFGFIFDLMLMNETTSAGWPDISGSGIQVMGLLAGTFYLVFTVFLLLEMLSEEVEVISTDDLEKLTKAKKEAKAKVAAAAAKRKAEEDVKQARERADAAEKKAST